MNQIFRILYLSLTFCFGLNAQTLPNFRSEFIYETKEVSFPSCHASTIVEASPDRLLAAWFGGTHERHQDVCIYLSSNINGTWSVPVKVADGAEDGTKYPCWNPVLFALNNGIIVLYYKVGPNPRQWWGMYKTSRDGGTTWSSATKIPQDLLGPIKNKPFQLKNGTLLYPTSFETKTKWHIYLESSDQNLQNWQKIPLDNQDLQSIQPTILDHGQGTLQLLCRSQNNCITTCWSKDGGQTWGKVIRTDMPNNNSGIDAVTLADGRFLLVHTPLTEGRHKLVVSISSDGQLWTEVLKLEDDHAGTEYSYPAVIQANDGQVHLTYTWKRELIKYVTFDPHQL